MVESDPEFFFDIAQNTPEWFEIRRGIPTASEFQTILANGKGRDTYMRKKAGEILSGVPNESMMPSFAMLRGKEQEPEARDYFARSRLVAVEQCGFVRRLLGKHFVGFSPDGLFDKTVLEIKSMRQDLAMLVRENDYDPNVLPEEHVAQCQGGLWVTGFERVELLIYSKGMPYQLHYSVQRDEGYIANLEREVERFDQELHALVRKHRGYK